MCSKRCPECPGGASVVPGGGPVHSRVVFIGEAPGATEDFEEVAFTGKAGNEFNYMYLPRFAKLDRSKVYVTNTVKCRPTNNKKPGNKLIESCSKHWLPKELKRINPELVVLMGATACQLVPGMKVDLEHGKPRKAELFGHEYTVLPTYHPALGLHKTESIEYLRGDFLSIRRFLSKGMPVKKAFPMRYIVTNPRNQTEPETPFTIAVDRENDDDGTMYSIQWSWDGKTGYIAYPKGSSWKRDRKYIQGLLDSAETILFHYAQSDVPFCEDNGIQIPWQKVEDTMQMAFRLMMPQALKTITYRLFDIPMTDYMDVVWPHGVDAMLDWLHESRRRARRDKKNLDSKAVTVFNRLSRCIVENPGYDPWKAWANAVGKNGGLFKYGVPPKPSLRRVPVDQAVEYSGKDPIVTWLVWKELRKRQQEFGEIPDAYYSF